MEVGAVRAELVQAQRVHPAKEFLFRAFLYDGDLVVEESQTPGIRSGEDVAADDAQAVRDSAEVSDLRETHSGDGLDVGGILCGGAADGHLAPYVVAAFKEEPSHCGKAVGTYCPDGVAFEEGTYVADLNPDVAGGVSALEYMYAGALDSGKDGIGAAYGQMNGGNAAKGRNGRLDVSDFRGQGEFRIGRKGSGAECGNEDCLWSQGRVGNHSKGALHQERPEAAFQQRLAHLRPAQGGRVPFGECGGAAKSIRLYFHGEQLALVTPDNALDGSGDRRNQQNGGIVLVRNDGTSGQDRVSLLYQQPGNQAFEVVRAYRRGSARHLPYGSGGNTAQRYFQSSLYYIDVRHNAKLLIFS